MFGFLCLNDDEFEHGMNMIYSKWHEEVRLHIKVENEIIYLNNKRIGSLRDLEKYVGIRFAKKVDIEEFADFIDSVVDRIDSEEINYYRFKKILDFFKVTIEEFEDYYNSEDCELKDFLEYYPNEKKIIII